jgi:tyrosine-specific transport protein
LLWEFVIVSQVKNLETIGALTFESNQTYSVSRFFGATMIVAGTAIGAGMLALPMTSAAAGFKNSTFLLIGMWAFMCFSALITLEINLRFGKGISIAGLADQAFGRFGKWIASFGMMLLFYSLMAAYITGGTSFLQRGMETIGGRPVSFGLMAFVFTIGFGFFVNSCTQAVDYANRFLFIFKMIVFIVMISLLMPFVDGENLAVSTGNGSVLWLALPIFFTSFGFHGCIPSLINYVGPNPWALRMVMIVGSLIPLAVYLLWQTTTLGILPHSLIIGLGAENNVATFIQHLNAVTKSSVLGWLTNIFAFLAISTSFLGLAIGLFDFLAETVKIKSQSGGRFRISVLTFLPPLFFTLFYPDGFIMALGYAAIALSILAVLMPAAVALKFRSVGAAAPYQVGGGKILLALVFLGGIAIIAIEMFNQF